MSPTRKEHLRYRSLDLIFRRSQKARSSPIYPEIISLIPVWAGTRSTVLANTRKFLLKKLIYLHRSLKSGKKVPINLRNEERSTKRGKNSSRKRSKISMNLKKSKPKNGIYYRNSLALNNPRSICQLNNPSSEKPTLFKVPGLKLKTKSNSRNNKMSVDGTSSVSFWNNFNPNIQIVIPSTKHVKSISRANAQTMNGRKHKLVLGKGGSRKKASSRNSYSTSSKYSWDGLQRHSTFTNVPYNCSKF